MVHTRHARGHLLYWDTHRKRIVDAIGPNVVKYVLRPEALGPAGTDPVGFTTTVVEAGAGGDTDFNQSDTEGIVGRITTDNADNDGGSYQLLGEDFVFDADHEIYCALQCTINDVDQTDLLFGLCITDTALLAAMTDGVYFRSVDGSTDIDIFAEKNSTETAGGSVGTLVDATAIYLEFYWDGNGLEAFINGSSIYNAVPANIPDDEALRLSIEFLTGEAIANTLDVARLDVIQIGRS